MTASFVAVVAILLGVAVAGWPRGRPHLEYVVRPRRTGAGDDPSGLPAAVPLGEVAATCDLVALALRAGAAVDDTLTEVAAASEGSVAAGLRAMVAARRWGIDLPPDEIGGAAWAPLVRALRLADSAGVPPAASISAVAQDLRGERQHRLEVATARLRVQVVLPLGLCFLPAFVLTTVVPVVLALAGRVAGP